MHRLRRTFAAAAAAAVVSVGAAVPAVAAETAFPVPDDHAWSTEHGSARPTLDPDGRGFVFGMDGELHLPLAGTTNLTDFPLLTEMSGLAYQVTESDGRAPSFQLVVTNPSQGVSNARLVWEAANQSPAQGPNNGTFEGLENGRWWHATVFRPGASQVPQNQAARPFADFVTAGDGAVTDADGALLFGPETRVLAVSIRQGSNTDATAVVPQVAFNGATHSFLPGGTARPGPTTVEGSWTLGAASATDRYTEQSREVKTFDYEIDFATWTWVLAAEPTLVTTETRTVENPAWVDPTPTPEPTPTPAPPVREPAAPPVVDLMPELRTDTLVPGGQSVTAGGEVTLYVGRDLAGTWVDVFLFSDPVFLGQFLVAADGTVTATVPATLAGGDHRLVVADAATGEVVAWTQVAVAAAGTGTAANAVPRGATGWDEEGVSTALVAFIVLAGLTVVPMGTLAVRRIRG